MNTAELETLIRTILSEKLAPTPPAPQQEQGIFSAMSAAPSTPLIRLFSAISSVR